MEIPNYFFILKSPRDIPECVFEMHFDYRDQLVAILKESPLFKIIFARADQIDLADWYVAGGCVTQTIWNWKTKQPLLHGLKDVDLVYYAARETDDAEQSERARIKALFADLSLPIDVINEARVHEWYPKKFGDSIPAYKSTEDGIRSWLPAFSIGVRLEKNIFKVVAPFGLADAFEMVVRPNKRQITSEIYASMVTRLRQDWPTINVHPY